VALVVLQTLEAQQHQTALRPALAVAVAVAAVGVQAEVMALLVLPLVLESVQAVVVVGP
jgi:hypothetical protein